MYHGIVINKQFLDEKFVHKFKIFAKKQDGNWVIYGIEVEDHDIEKVTLEVQQETKEGTWYGHFYNDQKLIAVFKDKVFKVTPHESTWEPIIEYGKTLGIPEDQLTFWPNRFQDEIHYFKQEDNI